MNLSVLAGNQKLKDQLSRQEGGRGLHHAYILSGPAGSGRHTLAWQLAAAMLCRGERRPCGVCSQCKKVLGRIHPDVTLVQGPGEGKPVTVDQVRSVRADAFIRPNEGERKVYILERADQMNSSAQNAMLKLLEEGPDYAVFLLLAESAGGLLQTVRSRCEELPLAPVPMGECERWLQSQFPERDREQLRSAALRCQGVLGRAVEELQDREGVTDVRARQAKKLADALERGSERDLFECSMALEKEDREDMLRLLDTLETELTRRLGQRALTRLNRAVDLVRVVRGAAQFNANPGQLAGWLCAGMVLAGDSHRS